MRDEIDGRIWVAHHEQFSQSIDNGLAKLRALAVRLTDWDGSTVQLLALILSFGITALTFNTTTA